MGLIALTQVGLAAVALHKLVETLEQQLLFFSLTKIHNMYPFRQAALTFEGLPFAFQIPR